MTDQTEHATLAFVDTETTGLDPDQHEIWAVGLIVREQTVDEDGQPTPARSTPSTSGSSPSTSDAPPPNRKVRRSRR